MVEVVEVGDDDRHGQSDCEHTGNSAQAAHDLAPHSDRPVTRQVRGDAGRHHRTCTRHGRGLREEGWEGHVLVCCSEVLIEFWLSIAN